jgi:hypothetical protein
MWRFPSVENRHAVARNEKMYSENGKWLLASHLAIPGEGSQREKPGQQKRGVKA